LSRHAIRLAYAAGRISRPWQLHRPQQLLQTNLFRRD
jgi:hypothetical protein